MINNMYSVKDRLNGFTPPIPLSMDEVAERWFKELIDTNRLMQLSPDDFSLWYMGKFDTETGEYIDSEYRREVTHNGNENNL